MKSFFFLFFFNFQVLDKNKNKDGLLCSVMFVYVCVSLRLNYGGVSHNFDNLS